MAKHQLGERHAALCAWLTANNINIREVPLDGSIRILNDGNGGKTIRYTAYVLTSDGSIRAGDDGQAICTTREAPLLVEHEPLPPVVAAPCMATIEGPHVLGGGPVQCTREAGHPSNHVGPLQGDDGKTLWSDHHAGATPHRAARKDQS